MPISHRTRSLFPFAATSVSMLGALALPVCADTPVSASPANRLTLTASMSVERAVHTATTLPDGRALIAGGFTSEQRAQFSAELYDPRTSRFSPLPRMITVRHSHTATMLPNGKVLIAGGFASANEPVAAAELFDPATGTFAPTASLRAARAGHIAVLLTSGKVLIAGGVGPNWSFLSSAELYDPATGQFTPTSAMSVTRESHIAVRLRDGRVLIAGGHSGRRAGITLYSSAEIYDPATAAFTRVGDMRVRRHKHDAVLLRDGRVLINGGADERDDEGVYSTTELFDPGTGTFTPGPSMRRGRYKHFGSSVLLPDGVVLIAGGAPEAETYDPARGAFAIVDSDARMAGQFPAVTALGAGKVLITGGYGNGGGPRSSAWLYTP